MAADIIIAASAIFFVGLTVYKTVSSFIKGGCKCKGKCSGCKNSCCGADNKK